MSKIIELVKKSSRLLPKSFQDLLRRRYYARQIRAGTFRSPEPEFPELRRWLKRGDWAIDVGANIGHYTIAMSENVGPGGRIVAFEPIPRSFRFLCSNISHAKFANVIPLNLAASSSTQTCAAEVPSSKNGQKNYYLAHLLPESQATDAEALTILSVKVDDIVSSQSVALIKIDVEGFEFEALQGMLRLIRESRPTLIVENPSEKVSKMLSDLGYVTETYQNSPNVVFSFAQSLDS